VEPKVGRRNSICHHSSRPDAIGRPFELLSKSNHELDQSGDAAFSVDIELGPALDSPFNEEAGFGFTEFVEVIRKFTPDVAKHAVFEGLPPEPLERVNLLLSYRQHEPN